MPNGEEGSSLRADEDVVATGDVDLAARPLPLSSIGARASSDVVVNLAAYEAEHHLSRLASIEDPSPICRVSVVIPTLNEADNIPYILQRIAGDVHEVIIVDGHSTDDTVAVAQATFPAVRILLQDGNGKGNALACGFRAATGDIIVTMDADGSADPDEIPRFVSALMAGADFAKGTRFAAGGGSNDITRLRRAGNRWLVHLVNRLWHVDYTDLCYGYNAFWRRYLPQLGPDATGFEVETLLNIRAATAGLKVVEVPSFEASRRFGVSNLHARRDGMRVIRTIAAEWIRPS